MGFTTVIAVEAKMFDKSNRPLQAMRGVLILNSQFSILHSAIREFDGRIYRLSIGFPTHRKINFTANMPSPLKWTESFAFSRFQPTLCIRQGIYSVAGDDSHRTHVAIAIS